jgi:uncharacterized protein with PIN domain
MGLIKCPDCNREISESSKSCVQCGCPSEKWENKKTIEEIINDAVKQSVWGGGLGPKCPICGGSMRQLDAASRGVSFARGNFLGSLSKSLVCNSCGHMA